MMQLKAARSAWGHQRGLRRVQHGPHNSPCDSLGIASRHTAGSTSLLVLHAGLEGPLQVWEGGIFLFPRALVLPLLWGACRAVPRLPLIRLEACSL